MSDSPEPRSAPGGPPTRDDEGDPLPNEAGEWLVGCEREGEFTVSNGLRTYRTEYLGNAERLAGWLRVAALRGAPPSEPPAINAQMLAALEAVVEDWQIARETWRDSHAGPSTVPDEPAELKEVAPETVEQVESAIAAARTVSLRGAPGGGPITDERIAGLREAAALYCEWCAQGIPLVKLPKMEGIVQQWSHQAPGFLKWCRMQRVAEVIASLRPFGAGTAESAPGGGPAPEPTEIAKAAACEAYLCAIEADAFAEDGPDAVYAALRAAYAVDGLRVSPPGAPTPALMRSILDALREAATTLLGCFDRREMTTPTVQTSLAVGALRAALDRVDGAPTDDGRIWATIRRACDAASRVAQSSIGYNEMSAHLDAIAREADDEIRALRARSTGGPTE